MARGLICDESGTCGGQLIRAIYNDPYDLVGNHALQLGLIRVIRDGRFVQLILALARLGREDVATKCMLAHNLAGPGFFEPFRRTFMGL